MLAELAKACQAGDVRLGVYLCPRDDTHAAGDGGRARSPEKQAAYNELYRRQLTEILTQYGPMFEMWFDGGNIVPINDLINQFSPGSRQIIPIPATALTGLRLTVQESIAPVTIRELSVFNVNRPVPKLACREDSRPAN